MKTVRVYEHPLSPYAQKVKIALAEKGVPFEAILPVAIGSGARTGEFAAANPRGEVPVLVVGRAQGELAARLVARAAAQTAALQAWLEPHLEGRPWLNGPAFGMGDLCVAPFVNGSVGFGNGPKPGTRLADWLARVNERPPVAAAAQVAREAAAEAATSLGAVARQIASGEFKREYRDHRLEWMIRSGGLDVVLEGLARNNIRFIEFPGG